MSAFGQEQTFAQGLERCLPNAAISIGIALKTLLAGLASVWQTLTAIRARGS